MISLTKDCVTCFKTLSVEARFLIFQHLKSQKGKTSINSLVKVVDLTQPTVTFHINQMVAAGLVTKNKSGRNQLCEISVKCRECPLFK